MSRLDFARYFDAQYADFEDDLPLWTCLARARGGPVLELGCGTGRVLFTLARAGFDVVGLDHDPSMLARARLRLTPELHERVSLHLAELVDFHLGWAFHLAILACNTFAHLDDGEARRALHAIRHHLSRDGLLALDLPNPEEVSADLDLESGDTPLTGFVEPESGNPVQVYALQKPDPLGRKITVTWRYDELLPDGRVQNLTLDAVYHLRGRDVMARMLRDAGFASMEFYGDYDLRPLRPWSPRMTVLAEGVLRSGNAV